MPAIHTPPPCPTARRRLLAALYLHAALPALAALAPHDKPLRRAAAGARDVTLEIRVRGVGRRTLRLSAEGDIADLGEARVAGGALRLWFPGAGQFLRNIERRPAIALPLASWGSLGQLGRLQAAGRRHEALLREPTLSPELHVYGGLAVALAGAATWLRKHPSGRTEQARLGNGVVTFACPALPTLLWFDSAAPASGIGAPPRAPVAELWFRDLEPLQAELTRTLDSLSALGGREMRVRGHLLVAERLGLLLAAVGKLLNPTAANRHR